ncbi:MAG TPA: sulfotransferase [Phycisphaerales bacterium]|nr:sulfotransferase [Phycisphaerales bacterium]HPO93062.1 sulfotransferase [Phycisphaerales bacterium]
MTLAHDHVDTHSGAAAPGALNGSGNGHAGPVHAVRPPVVVEVPPTPAQAPQVVEPVPQPRPVVFGPVGAQSVPGEPGMLFFGANRRSGTTWLAGMLNAHPQISCRNEGWLLTHREGSADNWLDRRNVARWSLMKAPAGQYVRLLGERGLERAIQRGMIREVVKQSVLAEGWKDITKLKWMGDKTTTHYCTKVEYLYDLFPDARFLYMQRDGRDVVVSDMFLMFRNGMLGADDDLTLEQARDIERARKFHLEKKGPPVPLFTPETMRYLAGNWVECVSGGLKAKSLYKDRFYCVRYEDMVADPVACVRNLLSWLEVETTDDFVHGIVEECRFEKFSEGRPRGEADPKAEWRKGIIGDWRNYFTEDDKAMFKRMAGGLLVELGYAKDLNW